MKQIFMRSVSLLLSALLLPGLVVAQSAGVLPSRIVTPVVQQAPESFADQPAFRMNFAEPDKVDLAIVAQERHTDALMRRPGVRGTAVGWGADGNPVIKIYAEESASAGGIPETLDGIPVDVEFVGRVYALNVSCDDRDAGSCTSTAKADAVTEPGPREYHPRPVPIGVSAGHYNVTAGTLACRVSRGCHNYALSNAHVFADENSGQPGDAILQPGDYDGGINPDDAIGYLAESVPITMTSTAFNRVDAAIALVGLNQVGMSTPAAGYGTPKGSTLSPKIGMNVMKYGRTTSMTYGYIDAVNATVLVTYRGGDARFIGQTIIKPSVGSDFSRPGDSGSLVVASAGADARKPVGLLFASGTGISVANPINEVLTQLDIDIDGE